MLVPLITVFLWRRGRTSLWSSLGWGALAWVVAIALKFACAIPTISWVRKGLDDLAGPSLGGPLFWIYAGLLTGVFECGVVWFFVAKTRLRRMDGDHAVAFGMGFGGVEAFLVGAAYFVGVLLTMVFFDRLPPNVRDQAVKALGVSIVGIPLLIIERAAALLIHVVSCVLIIRAVQTKQWRWFWLAFGYKTLVDGLAAWAMDVWRVQDSLGKTAQLEAVFCALALAGLVGLVWVEGKAGVSLRAAYRLWSRVRCVLCWQLTSETLDVRIGQGVCFAAAPAVLVLAVYKLARLPLSEAEFVIGLLASLAVTLLLVILGVLVPLVGRKMQPNPFHGIQINRGHHEI
jgi:uncharacterized membrane protein YhfC